MTPSSSVDVAVVGGGVSGAACAYFLAKAGMKVALVERGDLAAGCSGGCDGNIMAQDHQPGYDTNLTIQSNRIYQQILPELDWDIEYTQKGSILVIETPEELDFMLDRMKQQLACGLPVRFVDQDELYEQEPLLAPGFLGAIECASDASCMPIQVAVALARAARRLGAEIRTYEEVKSIKRDEQGRIAGLVTDRGEIRTPRLVNCCGAWAPFLGKMVGLDIPIIPRRGQLVVVEQTAQVGHRKISEAHYVVAKFHPELTEGTDSETLKYGVAFVFEPTASGNMLLGSSREFAGYDTRTTYPVIRAIIRRAVRFIPALAQLHCIRTYAGLRPYTPDHLPIISAVEEVPGFYIAAGHEGDGIGVAPLTGQLITQIILGQETTVDVTPLRWSRFARGAGRQAG
ncbi:MAG: FAD-dependent oxidoreductase [Bacillota bacterium]|nr:FAD-dependent oxidoreductase [Bacillota bacterium]